MSARSSKVEARRGESGSHRLIDPLAHAPSANQERFRRHGGPMAATAGVAILLATLIQVAASHKGFQLIIVGMSSAVVVALWVMEALRSSEGRNAGLMAALYALVFAGVFLLASWLGVKSGMSNLF